MAFGMRASRRLSAALLNSLRNDITPAMRSSARCVIPALTSQTTHPTNVTNTRFYAKAAVKEKEEMFCFQCEQTKLRRGCTIVGVCGKTPEVAALQDLLMYAVQGLSIWGYNCREIGLQELMPDLYDFISSAIFSTLTNVNFDAERFVEFINEAVEFRDLLKTRYEAEMQAQGKKPKVFTAGPAVWQPSKGMLGNVDKLVEEGKKYGVRAEEAEYGESVNGVRQMSMYGLKGMATYSGHARRLGRWDDRVGAFMVDFMNFMTNGPESERHDLGVNLGWALKVGEINLLGLEMLDSGHKAQFGTPSPHEVKTTPTPGKSILVSGHDIHDLRTILEKTKDTDINVYTHGEMLPAHGYPEIRAYKNLVGHFGGAWQTQKYEFPTFPGAVVVTTNCLVEPLRSYKHRIFTTNEVGFAGVTHVELDKDIDLVIQAAQNEKGFSEADCEKFKRKPLLVGFGHDEVISHAEKLLGAVQNGELKRVFVIGGCDGSEHKRNYFTNLADSLPKETVILTMGCAKFRFNNHEFGTLGTTGIPRLLDMGQCNDSYGAVVVAKTLAQALDTDVNSLPLSISLSWFEQKAVAVLLSLLHLGIKNIRLGPVLPAFLTPPVLDILVEKFNIVPVDIRHPEEDLKIMMAGK